MVKTLSAIVLVVSGLLMPGLLMSGPAVAADAEWAAPGNAHFSLENYAGKVVYVDFWASWCKPCRHSFPFMNQLQAQFGDELAIVAINVDESRDDALRFLEALEPQFEIVYDPRGELAAAFDVPGMPTSYLFSREGRLLQRHIGFKKSQIEALRKTVADAVNETAVLAESD